MSAAFIGPRVLATIDASIAWRDGSLVGFEVRGFNFLVSLWIEGDVGPAVTKIIGNISRYESGISKSTKERAARLVLALCDTFRCCCMKGRVFSRHEAFCELHNEQAGGWNERAGRGAGDGTPRSSNKSRDPIS